MEEYRIPKEALEKLKDPQILRRQMEEGKTFQEIIGYTKETMERFYLAARSLFAKQEYKQSAESFLFLSTLNPYVYTYWLGLGMSEQMSGHYQEALLAYAMATLLDIDNPLPYYHSASCYRALNDKTNTLLSLEHCNRAATKKEEFKELKERTDQLLEKLKK